MSQELGTYDSVSIKDVLSGVRMRLFMKDTTQDDMLLKDIIIDVLKRMRSPNMFVRAEAYIDIEDGEAKLPDGFIRFEHYDPIRFIDGSGNEALWCGPEYVNDTFFKGDPNKGFTYFNRGRVTENNGYLFFSDVQYDRCLISYRSTEFSCDGDLMIRADMESPLMIGCLWQYNLLIKDFASADRFERQFKINKRAIKGIQNLPTSLERKLNHIIMNTYN